MVFLKVIRINEEGKMMTIKNSNSKGFKLKKNTAKL